MIRPKNDHQTTASYGVEEESGGGSSITWQVNNGNLPSQLY